MSIFTGEDKYKEGMQQARQQTERGVAQQKEYTERALGQVAPYQKVGTEALDMYRNMVLGGDMSQFQTSPGYQFRLGEGVNALEQGASARGDLLSGSQQKALMGFGQNLASQEYGNYANRLGDLAGQGLQAGGMAGGYLSGTGSNISNAYGQLGQTQAQMSAQQGQAQSGFWNSLLQAGGEVGGAMAGVAMASDERLKENIKRTGETINEIEIVEFNYNEKSGMDTSKRYRGVIAQEVEKIIPDAVIEENGFKKVDYSKIGIKMEEI